MSNVLEHDTSIVETLRNVEDILVRFALQNHAAAGAVFPAHYTTKMPVGIAASAVVALNLVFSWAIWSNVGRYRLSWRLQRIVRDE